MASLSILVWVVALSAAAPEAARADAINAIVGDASWTARFGGAPDRTSDDGARIEVHLRYALERLRARDVSELAAEPRHRRQAALDGLERYLRRGVFPRRSEDAYPGRRPRFIDDRGVHCAVAQLIADSGAAGLARMIAAEHEYAYLDEIRSPALDDWASRNGFTRDELALIQPRYRPPARMRPIRLAIERATAMIGRHCAARFAPVHRFPIRVFVNERGDARAATYTAAAFAQCFVSEASRLVRTAGRPGYSPEDYYFEMEVVLPRLERTLVPPAP